MDFELTVLGPLEDVVRTETDMVDGCRDEMNPERTLQETLRVVQMRMAPLRPDLISYRDADPGRLLDFVGE